MGRAFEYRKARKLKRWGNMARTFTKIGKEISIAVKAGGPDPDANPRLRVLMQNAKAANMPKENVERAIKRAISKDTSDYKEMLKDEAVDLVMITTRHNLHAPMVLDALYAGKHVFVEKPLCLNQKELGEIVTAYQMAQKNGVTLTVGFNRRFSSFAVKTHNNFLRIKQFEDRH